MGRLVGGRNHVRILAHIVYFDGIIDSYMIAYACHG